MFDTGVLAFRHRQEHHRYLDPAIFMRMPTGLRSTISSNDISIRDNMSIIGRTLRAILALLQIIPQRPDAPAIDFIDFIVRTPFSHLTSTVLQYLSSSFRMSALKLPFSCYFIFLHRYRL
jgi:hypothetical protein